MADDIDIEEHDVLDNPALKSMFPDISVLKQEIKNFETGIKTSVDKDCSKNNTEETKRKGLNNEVKHAISCFLITDDDEVIEVNDDPVTDSKSALTESLLNSNKIILGSKPSKALECGEQYFEDRVKSYNVRIVLDDMRSYLDTSGRFCHECLILFPSTINLEIHNKSSHAASAEGSKTVTPKKQDNYKLKFKCTKCNIFYRFKSSLSRHIRKDHKGTYPAQKLKIKFLTKVRTNVLNKKDQYKPKQYKCFHCKKVFSSQLSLIEHLYSTLQSTKYKCEDCPQNFTNIEKFNNHVLTHKKCVVVVNNVANDVVDNPEINKKPEETRHRSSEETNSDIALNWEEITEALKSFQNYYRCYICSYYFIESDMLSAHLANKHNIYRDVKEMKKEKFNALCKYCSKNCNHIKRYNRHVGAAHRKHANYWSYASDNAKNGFNHNTPITAKQDIRIETTNNNQTQQKSCDRILSGHFVLKSALFKCLKCDIHFISSKLAKNHTEHMEMLINWKCLTCKHIFKKEDETLHEEQHKYSQEFTVYDLCPVTSSPILYNCSKCSVHFDEINFLKHYFVCENDTENSVFCIICDIVIDNALSKLHRSEHISKSLKQTDFIIVNSDIIKTNTGETTMEVSREKKCEQLKRKCREKSTIPCKKEKQSSNLHDLTYCHICKCFLAHTDDQDIHVKGNCQYLEKYICKICGLLLTAQSYTTTHRNVHNLTKNLKLKDFQFYDIKSHDRICPPVPEYLKCENCDIYHISKDAIFSHECSETEYLTCHLCNINLTEDAFKLHMQFHNYSVVNIKNKRLTEIYPHSNEKILKMSVDVDVLKKGECSGGKDKKLQSNVKKKCRKSRKKKIVKSVKKDDIKKANLKKNKSECKQSVSQVKLQEDVERRAQILVKPVKKDNIKETNLPKRKAECKQSATQLKPQKDIVSRAEIIVKPVNKDIIREINLAKTKSECNQSATQPQKDNERSRISETDTKLLEINLEGVIYQCVNCNVSVDSYDKVIEHCQGHYCGDKDIIETVECQICGISLSKICAEKHEKLHLDNKNTKFFTVIRFDIFYFTSENGIWIEHIFGTLPQKERDKILKDSIYRHECRIKLDVIQNGQASLTVYKCDKCRSYIDENSLYKHSENSCFKLRKHPCSVCGLPFNSSVSRIKHESVHDTPNINLESYRIVTFNREEDISINKLLYRRSQYYTLYQCRNCSIAIDRSQIGKHECCKRNLKICTTCGLLLLNEDFDNHTLRHKELPNFIEKNIKIILFGESKDNAKQKSNDMVPVFPGIVYDYTFYSCSKCEVCVKSNTNLDKHACNFGANRLKCSKCKLYFLTSKLKHHIKLHETDPDFVRENMRVIIFNSQEDLATDVIVPDYPNTDGFLMQKQNEINSRVDSHTRYIVTNDVEEKINRSTIEEKCTKIYKCPLCGLHYLDQYNIVSHFKICEPKTRVAKQKCTKCSLLFTAEVLFTHLIMHHGNKAQIYKFNVIDISEDKIIYRCTNCNLHFEKLDFINNHFQACDGTTEGKDCIFCGLKFESESFLSHNCNIVNNVDAGVEVVDLNEPLLTKNATREIKQLDLYNKELNKLDTATVSDLINGVEIISNSDTEAVEQNNCSKMTATNCNNEQLDISSEKLNNRAKGDIDGEFHKILFSETETAIENSPLETPVITEGLNQIDLTEPINSHNDEKEHNEVNVSYEENQIINEKQSSCQESHQTDFGVNINVVNGGNNNQYRQNHWRWRQQRKVYKNKFNRFYQNQHRMPPPWHRNTEHWHDFGGANGPYMEQNRFRPPIYPVWNRLFDEQQ